MSETVSTATTTEAQTTPPPTTNTSTTDELPDWARQQISSANADAAKYRVQFREADAARQSLQEQVASLTAEKTQVVSDGASIQADFDKLVTAIQAEIPHKHIFAFANTLQGSTAEELTAHADDLKSMFGLREETSAAFDRSQGHGSTSTASDPATQFASFINDSLK